MEVDVDGMFSSVLSGYTFPMLLDGVTERRGGQGCRLSLLSTHRSTLWLHFPDILGWGDRQKGRTRVSTVPV